MTEPGSTRTDGTVCLGVCSDIQYRSDQDDMFLEKCGHIRSYRAALPKAVEAVKAFSERGVSHILHLGDIIDGRFKEQDRDLELPAVIDELDEVLHALNLRQEGTEMLHVVGNHCLYVGRDVVEKRLGLERSYYTRILSDSWRLIVLDTVEVSVYHDEGDWRNEEAERILERCKGEPNAVPWNGTIGKAQCEWLRSELATTRKDGAKCIVCGHFPQIAEAAAEMHVMWLAEETVLPLLKEYNDVVAAYFNGHFHSGGYAVRDGVHHLTVASILDSDETNSYAFVTLGDDAVTIEGIGKRGPASQTLSLPPRNGGASL